MFPQIPQHIWDDLQRDCRLVSVIREDLRKKSESYLRGIVKISENVRGYLKFRAFLNNITPFSEKGFYEPLKEYELAREILAEKDLKNTDVPTLIDTGKETFWEKLLYPFNPTNSDEALRKRAARKLLDKMIPKRQERLFDFY